MYKKMLIALSFTLGIVLFTACGESEPETPLQILLDTANYNRLQIGQVDPNIAINLAYAHDFYKFDLTDLIMQPDDEWPMQRIITIEDAIADTYVLFDILRYVYAAYEYFGGDEVFDNAKANILAELNTSTSRIQLTSYDQILRRYLSPIILDGHFGIYRIPYLPQISILSTDNVMFERINGDRFRNIMTGQYLLEITDHEIEDVLRLSLNNNGDIVYTPVVYVQELVFMYSINMIYEEGDSENIDLQGRLVSANVDFDELVSFQYVDGFPVVSLMAMRGLDSIHYGEDTQRFMTYAEELRDEPIVILDLRANQGGISNIPLYWMYLLTGEVVHQNMIIIDKWSYGIEYPWTPWGGTPETNPFYFSEENWERLSFLYQEPYIANTFQISKQYERQIISREQTLIVLVDRNTASAGEMFTDLVFNVENTLVVGQNTMGILTASGSYPNLRLPYSGAAVSLGRQLMLHPEGHFTEGVGFAPDVWVNGDALTAVVAMLKNSQI